MDRLPIRSAERVNSKQQTANSKQQTANRWKLFGFMNSSRQFGCSGCLLSAVYCLLLPFAFALLYELFINPLLHLYESGRKFLVWTSKEQNNQC